MYTEFLGAWIYPYMECQMFTQCNRDINRQIYGPSLLSVNECVAHKRDAVM